MLKRLTKSFLLNERLNSDPGAAVQALQDIFTNIKVHNKRDTNRLKLAQEHLRSIKRELRRMNEHISSLQNELNLLKEEK